MRIVIAEDQALLREGLVRMLENAAHTVAAAVDDGDRLRGAVSEHRADLAVVDVWMPPGFRDEGIRAANWIRQTHPDVGVLVLSQHVESAGAISLVTEGGFGYLLKGRVLGVKDFLDAAARVADETGWDLADLADRDNPNGFPKEWTSSSHMITNVLIEVDGDRAESESYYFATMRFDHEGTTYQLVAEGRYVDHWERRDGGTFKITDRIVVTDGLRTDATDGTWPGPDTDVPKGFYGGPTWPVGEAIWGARSEDDVSCRILRGVGAAARS